MVMDNYGQYLSSVRNALLTTLAPIEHAANVPFQVYAWVKKDISQFQALEKELNQLKTENLLLKTQQLKLTNLEQEVETLNKLLGSASKMAQDFSPTIATVDFYSSTPYSQFFTINKGFTEGIQAGRPVLDHEGVVGQVINTTPSQARVLLITDPDSQIPVRIQRTGQRGILAGLGNNQLLLNFIPNSSSILEGDILETSGLGGLYPSGYPVALIKHFETQADNPYFKIDATPISQLQKTRKVLVLNTDKKTEAVNKGIEDDQ